MGKEKWANCTQVVCRLSRFICVKGSLKVFSAYLQLPQKRLHKGDFLLLVQRVEFVLPLADMVD